MMKSFSVAAVSLLASSAMAFAPASTSQSSKTALNAGMPDRLWDTMVDKTQRSASVPFLPRAVNLDGTVPGDYGFDPFYLSSIPKDFSGFIQPPSWEEKEGTLPTLYWMRESEIKHGRVAMLAVTGWIAADNGFRFPLEAFSTSNVPSSYNAHDILVGNGVMGFMLLAVGFVEFCTGAALVQVSKGEIEREPGEFKLGTQAMGTTPEAQFTMKTKEINNGRLAMLAFGGIATQTALGDTYHGFPYF